MPDKLLNDLIVAVDAAAETFHGRGSQIKERELEMALETALWALRREPRRQLPIHLDQAWSGRVGGVDLAIAVPEGTQLIELKWDPETLAACAWDSVKLAAALQAGEGKRAFLIAGSPASGPLRGDELLESGEGELTVLKKRYQKDFDFWRTDVNNHPLFAPASWRIQLRSSASFEFKGEPWQLRLAELELTGSELVPFE